MSNKHENLTSLFVDIADAIREKTGGTAAVVADDFPDAIRAIEGGGASLDTCTLNFVDIFYNGESDIVLITTSVNDSVISSVKTPIPINGTGVQITNVLCGGCAIFESKNASLVDTCISIDGVEYVYFEDYEEYYFYFTVPNKKDGVVEILIDSAEQQ